MFPQKSLTDRRLSSLFKKEHIETQQLVQLVSDVNQEVAALVRLQMAEQGSRGSRHVDRMDWVYAARAKPPPTRFIFGHFVSTLTSSVICLTGFRVGKRQNEYFERD
jgi:hypothetical protein